MDNRIAVMKCIGNILDKSNEARAWYLKTDLKVRLKLFVSEEPDLQDLINIWKRINIIKKDFVDSQPIIDQAIKELAQDFKDDKKWVRNANNKLYDLLATLNDDSVKIIN